MLGAQTVGLGCDKEVDAFVYYESVVEITAVVSQLANIVAMVWNYL